MITQTEELVKLTKLRPPHKESLAYMLARTLQKKAKDTGPKELWSRADEYRYRSWEPIFTAIETATHSGIDDASVIRALYGTSAKWDWKGLFGGATGSTDAKNNLIAMRRHAIYMFMQPVSVGTLDSQSYPYTYLNKDVAKLFNETDSAKDKSAVGGRVQATAQIMFRILYGNTRYSKGHFFETRTLFSAFTLGLIHQIQLLRSPFKDGSHYYFSQGALAWTLLTFSYFIAKAWKEKSTQGGFLGYSYSSSDFQEGQWYRFWGIIGSCMGIANELIPRTHAEAKTLYELFETAKLSNTHQLTKDNKRIFEVYQDKRDPNKSEFAKLLSWVPNYFGNQWTHPLSWGSYGLSLSWSALSWVAQTVKKKTIG